jgi:hypothetical protein
MTPEPSTPHDWIRVSCATLCRIEHQGRFLLLLNANRRQKGTYQLGPIGGALRLLDLDRLAVFEAALETPGSDDLRLTLPRRQLDAFRAWFATGEGRERTPFRELHEELVSEAGLLPALRPEDVDCRYLWQVEEEALTDRLGQTGLLTHYFLEIYNVRFKTSKALGPLLVARPDSGAVWLTAEQILHERVIQLDVDGTCRDVRIRGELVLHPPEES